MSERARILIAGGGVGGLALAQALRRGGLDVAVYERDSTPTIRNQGYRIHIDADGNEALRACLPAGVLGLVRDTSGLNGDLVASYTHRLEQVMAQEFPADFNRGFVWVADGTGQGAGFAPVRFRSQPHRPDYLMTTFVAAQEALGVPDEELFTLPP
jgi:monoamine oxidase